MYLKLGEPPRRSVRQQLEKGIAELLVVGDRLDGEIIASENDFAVVAWTGSEAEGVQGQLQLRRDSNQHARDALDVNFVPKESERHRSESLENKAKANVGKTCYVNV